MDIKKYQEWTLSTAVYPGAGQHNFQEIVYLTLGLASEAGELAGKLKKIVRGDNINPEDFVAEAGDVLWYLARICDNINIDLEQLAEYNCKKLSARKEAGTIQGEDQDDGSRIITASHCGCVEDNK